MAFVGGSGRGAFAAIAFSVAAGCASATTLDGTQLTADLPAAVAPERTTDVSQVDCPLEPPRGVGLVATCTARLGDDSITIDIEQLDDDGTVQFRIREPLVEVAAVEGEVGRRIAEELAVQGTVVCAGSRQRVLLEPIQLDCDVDDGSEFDRRFRAAVAVDGSIEIELGAG